MKGWRERREEAEAVAVELGLRRESEEREKSLLAATLNIMVWLSPSSFFFLAGKMENGEMEKWWGKGGFANSSERKGCSTCSPIKAYGTMTK
ncbi:hypothetical protein TIFTF001_026494 [Ficus carica]|uniref:Uncharacterized protein n=1 Tax=Ficus carica TaxID=3494 RepID=A0AA88DLK4_FICCA|nr:hypothetical protein TIFTF001_026494 [Ficus carica]